MNLPQRPRRNRKNAAIRGLIAETSLSVNHLIYPLFVHQDKLDIDLVSLPGQKRFSPDGLFKKIETLSELGLHSIALFPKIKDHLKTSKAQEAYNPEGLIPQLTRSLKQKFPHLVIINDIALDPYSSDGHDGLVSSTGEILNDETVEILCQQAICQAQAGTDIVAPSDMMDGRIGAIRQALDQAGYSQVSIMSYCAKYASAFYGPFRGALDSAPRYGDKKTYQMDPANQREAIRECTLDEAQGADIIMVKPAGAYLDVISALRSHTTLPIAAYQVSGEYLMIKSAAAAGWLNEPEAIQESLISIRRAGADMILTYFAEDYARLQKSINA
jgi:porphobilinogen synthase